MAEVYRAKSFGAEDFEKLVAIKRLYPHLCEDHSFVRMFINEAKLAATLNHVNIAPIFDFGQQQGLYYIAMEYVRGCDLADLITRCREKNQPLPLGLAIWLLIEICNGLDYAHRKHDDLGNFLNLIHRDITPQNILISYEGEVKLADFGIAKVQMLERDETTGGILKGKFSYMSPEQVRGERMDHRSDIFSLGIVAWELLTCRKMFDGPNDYHILEKVREALFVPPRQINPELPVALEQIVMKALTRHQQERYSSVGEMRLALLRLLSSSRLFPSRAHLSAFVRKLFQDKLQRERKEIIEETEASREIWNEHKDKLGGGAQLSQFASSSLLPASPPNAKVEVLASAPPVDFSTTVGDSGPQVPPHLRGENGVQRPGPQQLATLPGDLDLGLDEDEDPTLPDILGISPDEATATAAQPLRPRPPAGAPGTAILGPPKVGPVPPPPASMPAVPAPLPLSPTAPASGPLLSLEQEELSFQPAGQRSHASLLIGGLTFLLGVGMVFVFSWLLRAPAPSKSKVTPAPRQLPVASRKRPKTRVASHKPARLIIQTTPWARVYLNNEWLNRTPLNEVVVPGKHQVTLQYPNLSRDLKVVQETFTIVLRPGEVRRLKRAPRRR